MPDLELENAMQRFVEQRRIFSILLDSAFAIDKAISGTRCPSEAAHKGAVLFTKAFAHAIALQRVAPQANFKRDVFDVGSCAVLLRAISETYITFCYCTFEANTDEESEFRFSLMELHRRLKQYDVMKGIGVAGEKLQDAANLRDIAHKKLTLNAIFQKQSEKTRQKQLDGLVSKHQTLSEIADAARINKEVWGAMYAFLSQFAHSSPMAVVHLANYRADSVAGPLHMSMLLQWASGLLAKFILDMQVIFPSAGSEITPEQTHWITVEREVIEGLAPNK